MNNKREKCKNFSEGDRQILLNIIKKYRQILEDKSSNMHMVDKKKSVWEQIHHEFCDVSDTGTRTIHQLKIFYKNSKQKLRKEVAEFNKQNHISKIDKGEEIDGEELNASKKTKINHKKKLTVEDPITLSHNPYDDSEEYHDIVNTEFQNTGSHKTVKPSNQANFTSPAVNRNPKDSGSNQGTVVRKKIKVIRNLTNMEKLKQIYIKKQIELADYRLFVAKTEHAIRMKIKNLQLRKLLNTNDE